MIKEKVILISSFLITFILIQGIMPAQAQTSHDFEFTLLDSSVVSLSDYSDKPIILDWSASWCTFCKENQKTFEKMHPEYKNLVEFITISYGGSGDDLSDVKSMKDRGNYNWTFALDHTDYASTVGTQNADIWILDTNRQIVKEWDHAIVGQTTLSNELAKVIGNITSLVTSEVTITSGNTTFVKTTTYTTTSSININDDKEINTLGLGDNPIFLGFLGVSAVIAAVIGVLKIKKD